MGIAILLLGVAAGGGVLLIFVSMARTPAPAGGLRGQLDAAFQGVTERLGERERSRGRPTLEERLARAGLRLRPSEYIVMQAGAAGALGLLAILRFGVSPAVPLAAGIGAFLPGLFVRFRISHRLRRLNNQLSDVLSLMANSLKAGHALPQTLEVIANESRPPIAEEFARCVREMNLGGTVEESLGHMVKRIESDDLDLMVTAVAIHRTVGGNLAEILDNIAFTIRERVRIKGQIATLTASARSSGQLITSLPIILAVFMYFATPTYFKPMTESPIGWIIIAIAGFMIFLGNLVMGRVTAIEV